MLTAIVAMQKEADALLSQADSVRESSLFGKKIFEGTAFGQTFALVLSGVRKSNAAAAAMLAVSALGAKKLLNFGRHRRRRSSLRRSARRARRAV